MALLDDDIKRVNNKLLQLLRQYQQLQKENERLKAAAQSLETGHALKTKQVEDLQLQVAILKTAAGSMDEIEKKNFDIQISRYIKELEKCIGILSE